MADNQPVVSVPDVGEIIALREGHPQYSLYFDKFHQTPSSWRVDGWLKSWTPPKRPAPDENDIDAYVSHILNTILDEGNQEIDAGKGPTRMVSCTREEAEYVSGCGVGGCIWPVEDVVVIGKVNWTEEFIEEQRQSAIRRIGRVIF